MASSFYNFGSSRSSSFSIPSTPYKWPDPPTRRKKKDSGGVFGFLGNLIGDVKDTAVGIPMGVKEFVTNPIRSVEAIGESYSAMYGPLFHGDFDKFGRNLYEHPLGPILDAVALATAPFTAGGSLALRGGSVLQKMGFASTGSKVFEFGAKVRRSDPLIVPAPGAKLTGLVDDVKTRRPANYAIKQSSTRPTQRGLQKAVNKLMVGLPDSTPILGATSRFGRLAERELRMEATSLAGQARRFTRTFRKMSDPERAAFSLLSRGVHPTIYRTYLDELGEKGAFVEKSMVKALDDPKVKQFFESPSKKMQEAITEGRRLADLDADLKIKYGWLTPEEALEAPFQWMRFLSGARHMDARAIIARQKKIEKKLRAIEKIEARQLRKTEGIAEKGTPALRAVEKEADRLTKESSGAARRRERLRAEADGLERTKAELEAVKRDLDAVATGGPIPDIDTRLAQGGNAAYDAAARSGVRYTKDAEKMRMRALGKLYDRVIDLQAKYERQSAAYFGLQERLQEAARMVERQSENFDNILTARAERAQLLRSERAMLDTVRATRREILEERKAASEMMPGLHGGKTRQELLDDIAEGRGIEPFYMPDAAVAKKVNVVAKSGGGKSAPRSPVFVNKGVRMRMGQIALQPDVLTPEFLGTVKTALHSDIHATLVNAASRLQVGQPLPKGWVFVRRRSSERIGPTERERHLFEESMDSFTQADDIEAALVSRTDGEAVKGYRMIVPEKLVKTMAGEYRRSSKFIDLAFNKPTTIWRKLVLGLRPAFLVNNVVGNHFLYALSYAGFDGLRAYVNSVKTSRGLSSARRMIRDGSTPADMREALMIEFFPDQVHGTFGETQFPATMGRKRQKIEKASLGVMPITQRWAEGSLRRAAVEAELRRSPEFIRVANQMPKQAREFDKVARIALEANPALARQISKSVNDALGDYFNMSSFERHFVRQLFPFYAWNRAIFMIALRLPSRAPLKTVLMNRISALGLEETNEALGDVPSFLRGAVPLSNRLLGMLGQDVKGDRTGILSTQGINPFHTVSDEMEALAAVVGGEPGAAGREIFSQGNPVLQAVIEAGTGRDLFSGAPISSERGLLGNIGANFLENLPPSRLFQAGTGRMRQGTPDKPTLFDNTLQRYLANFLGVPVRQLSRKRAKAMFEEETTEPIKRKKKKGWTFNPTGLSGF